MSKYLVAADAIKKMAIQYKNIVAVAEALEMVGSVENAEKEARSATKDAQLERDQALNQLAKAKEQVSAAKQTVVALEQAAKDSAASIVEQANQAADKIKADAYAKATAMVDDAAIKANDQASSFNGQLAVLQGKVDALTIEVAEIGAKKLDMQASAEAAEARLIKVQSQIRKMAEA